MALENYSQHSFYPFSNQLKPVGPLSRFDLLIRANRVNEKINSYSIGRGCKSIESDDLRVGIYGELGRGAYSEALSQDLQCLMREYYRTGSLDLKYWAVFYDTPGLSESLFRDRMIQELTYLKNVRNIEWNEKTRNFSFHLEREKCFSLGLHTQSRELSTRFCFSTLVFAKGEILDPCPYQIH